MTPTDGESADERAVASFVGHDAFDRVDDGSEFRVRTSTFPATSRAREDRQEGAVRVLVAVALPTLQAAVVDGDAVADVVEDGWFDTLGLRLEDAYDVAEVEPAAEPVVTRETPPVTVAGVELESEQNDGRAVLARFEFRLDDPAATARRAKTIVDYVEGTYVQGVIPGYEYGDPVAGLLASAQHDDGPSDDARRGGTPL